MNDSTLYVLCLTAASLGFFHTIIGPDHYLPFIVMSKVRNWSLKRTMGLTFLCGVGHVLSSVLLGVAGIYVGAALSKLEAFESFRGGMAAQAMMIFGFSYCVWGIWRAIKNRPHTHAHSHDQSVEDPVHGNCVGEHSHEHVHSHAHVHLHDKKLRKKALTPWVLFVVFVLGPCEPLIPLMMLPVARDSRYGSFLVAMAFCVATLTTMLSVVLLSSWGFRFVKLGRAERFSHAMAGGSILLAGAAIQMLGI